MAMPLGVRIRLSAMMFLQFMLFAAFFPQLAAYLGTLEAMSTWQKSLILSTMGIGCLASPVIGMIADRYFSSQKVLLVLNALSAGLLFLAAVQTQPTLVFIVLLGSMLCYMPTWGLTSSIAMANSPAEQFPQIRVFGSIGWVAGGVFSLVAMWVFDKTIDGTNIPLYCAAATCAAAALLALTLPDTPPPAKGKKASVVDALGLRTFTLMKDRNFAVFIVISLLVMIPFTIYWSYCSVFLADKGFKFITVTMNWGQAAEMIFMLLVTLALARMGVKWAMAVGLVALLARYVAFLCGGIFDQTALYFVGILVHGLIFGFFFVGGQIYINKKAPKEMQAQAQGFIFLVTFGVGLLIGNFFNGWLIDFYSKTVEGVKTYNWNAIWTITTIISGALLTAFLLFFWDKLEKENEKPEAEKAAA